MKQERGNDGNINVGKFCAIAFAAYVVLALAFFFLAGEQLHLRQSRGELTLPAAESGTVELVRGAAVEQSFTVDIQRLQSVSVQWSTYYRTNAGTVTMELWDGRDGSLLLSQDYDAAAIDEGGLTTLTAREPLEGLAGAPLLLRLSADSQPGSAVSPLMALTAPERDGFALSLNGVPTAGVLCLSAQGQDYIWTGLHYWKLVAGLGALLALLLLYIYRRHAAGKRSYVVYALVAVKKYRFLIRQLVSRDFKTKYKRSVLGVLWSFLNPLLTMLVQYVVFSTIFKSDIPNYPAYLLIGIVTFNFFVEACGMSLGSIIGNAGLITKVYMPKYIYPLTRVMSSMINLVISLIPLLIVCIFTGVQFHKSVILAIYFLMCVVIFSLGFGLILASSMVFFRDTQFLWGVLSMIWMYLTPLFYPESIVPPELRVALYCNPLYYFIKGERLCILDGISPEPMMYVQCFLMAMAMLAVGALIFRKSQDRFVLYL